MKTVILAGGFGTRLSEETTERPKPMVEIGGFPFLWHIMNIYAADGFRDFIVACGYKSEVIIDYFDNPTNSRDEWNIQCLDTGLDTMTGGRLRRLRPQVGDGTFMVTYGDGVGNIDIQALVEFHRAHGKIATVTAVHPPARFGLLDLDGDVVTEFEEKSPTREGWINGGFFVMEPEVLDYISGDDIRLEAEPMTQLAKDGQLMAFKHEGFWKPMDTLRERNELEELWSSRAAPWKVWE